MKIVRLSTFLDFGGVERRLINISYFSDNNEWLFCAINKGGFAEEKIKANNKRVVCFNLPYRIPNIGTIYRLYAFFKAEKPNVVHTSGAEANFHGVLAAKLARIPVIVSEEIGIPSQSKIAQRIFRLIYTLSNFVIGNSNPVIDFLRHKNHVPIKKLKLVSNPIIFPELPEVVKYIKKNEFQIISVSRLEAVKNIESMLRVIAKLKSENIKILYIIVGEGTSHTHLKQLAADLDINDNIIFTGFKNDPYPLLLQSDLYVLTSFSEGFSNSLVEAMYCAVPSLSTNVGAAVEIIDDNINGWIAPVNNDEELFLKLKQIIQMNDKERKEVGVLGRKNIIENYSLKKHIDLLTSIYKEI